MAAVFALGAVGAGSAQAEFSAETWGQFATCPYTNPEVTDCFYGATNGGKTGGFFLYGGVQVKLTKPIVIKGGYKGAGSEIEVLEPTSGLILESPEEPITKGLHVITKDIQEKVKWPAALKASFRQATKNKETAASVVIEMAGNECTTVPGCLDTESLIFETPAPPAFRLPLKVRVVNPWLEKLGGGPCQIGSDEDPIKQNLNTAGVGRAGHIKFGHNFGVTEIGQSQLTDTQWHISKAQGAHGCGGEFEYYVDRALNVALEVESWNLEHEEEPTGTGYELVNKAGITILRGTLFDGASEAILNAHNEGNPELP